MVKKPFIMWYGAVTDPSGYGEASRNYLKGLDKTGRFDIKLQNRSFWRGDKLDMVDMMNQLEQMSQKQLPPNLNDIMVVFNLTPEQYFVQANIRKFVGVTTFETDGIPAPWLLFMRAIDSIITYSQFNLETFKNAGVNRPIYVVPHGVDTVRYSPEGSKLDSLVERIAGRFAFGANFDWNERKNPIGLLRAYYQAFTKQDNVVFVLKVYHQYPIDRSIETIKSYIADIKREFFSSRTDLPPVLLVTDIIRTVDMPSFYRTLNAYVLVSRGEGWSLTHTEAMSTGLPTVGTNWSGNTEFMNSDNSYLVKCTIERIKDEQVSNVPHYKNQSWANPNINDLTDIMKAIYKNDSDVHAKALQARKDMCEKWTWDLACSKMADVLEQIYNS